MLSHQLRFHRRNAINRIYKQGKGVSGQDIAIKHIENNRDVSRFAIVVSKRVDKRAVVRNRIRRRIYEIIRKNYDDIAPGHDVLLTVFKVDLAKTEHEKLQSQVLTTLAKAGIHNPKS